MSPRVPHRLWPLLLSAVLSLETIPFCGAQTPTPSPTPQAKDQNDQFLTNDNLIEIFAQHREWVASKKKRGKEAKLKGLRLNQIKLKPLILSANERNQRAHPDAFFIYLSRDLRLLMLSSLPDLDLRDASLSQWDFSEVGLPGAHLERTSLSSVNARNASFFGAQLISARISDCDFTGAVLISADLTDAECKDSDFSGARLMKTIWRRARIQGGRFKDADLSLADLTGAFYEPTLNSIPYIPSFATTQGLSTLRFETSAAALVELRGALRDAGLRQQEREVNYSIQRQRWRSAMQSHKMIESWFQYVFFDLTCKYGMDPGLPLRILGAAIFLFAGPYFVAIVFRRRAGQSGIWVVRNKETVHKPERRTRALAVEMESWGALTRPRKVLSLLRASRVAFFFSLLSAFSIGFREINVRSWIARLQPREYTLRGTGWVRAVAGFQSLLSVYLLALWVLTYFGRPFE